MVKVVKGKDLQVGKIYKFSFSKNDTFMLLNITTDVVYNGIKYPKETFKVMTKNRIETFSQSIKFYDDIWFDELS